MIQSDIAWSTLPASTQPGDTVVLRAGLWCDESLVLCIRMGAVSVFCRPALLHRRELYLQALDDALKAGRHRSGEVCNRAPSHPVHLDTPQHSLAAELILQMAFRILERVAAGKG